MDLADEDATRPMTVLSQAGKHGDAFKVRYDPSTYSWQLVMPERDEPGAPEKVVSRVTGPNNGSMGVQLAVVYDDGADTITLYVDGSTNAEATAHLPDGWASTGPLQVGRARAGAGWGEYLKGDVDEVQAFAGAVRADHIGLLGFETDPCPVLKNC